MITLITLWHMPIKYVLDIKRTMGEKSRVVAWSYMNNL